MPIVNGIIKAEILQLLNDTANLELERAKDEFAQKLANVVENAIKSATVTVQPGIPVATTGGAGSTTGPGTGSLS